MSSAHSLTFPSLHLRHNSFFNPSRRFTYVTTHSQTLALFHLRHSSLSLFSNFSVTSPTSQVILQHLPSLYLRHSSLSNPSVASPTSQFIFRPFFRFSYVTSSSLNSPGEPPMCQFSSVAHPVDHKILKLEAG